MAKATDKAGIQFRTLNSSKGPAVRATRAQADRSLYRIAVRQVLENQPNLTLFQQSCDDLIVENDHVVGVVTQMGLKFRAKNCCDYSWYFPRRYYSHWYGKLQRWSSWRSRPQNALAQRLRALPFRVGRLKTGTPARLDTRSLDYSKMASATG